VQLWAESLGKININKTRQALTPIALIGPVDQHSFLQLIIVYFNMYRTYT
jgi:glucose-6-phosphate isomerase